jgi:fucose permease
MGSISQPGPAVAWRRLIPLSLAGLVVLGLGDGLLGVAWPSVRAEFGQPLAALGEVAFAQAAGYLTASPLSGVLSIRLGAGTYLVLAAAVGIVALAGFALAPVWPLFVVAAAAYGLWAGSIDAGMNAWMAIQRDVRAMNLLHFAYGVGATAGPLLMTASIALGPGWRAAYLVGSACVAAVFVGIGLTRRAWDRPASPAERAAGDGAGSTPWLLLGATLSTFLVYVGVEIAAASWTFSHLVGLGTPPALAGVTVSAFWAALTAGRLGMAVIGGRATAAALLLGSCLVAVAGTAVYVVLPAGVGALLAVSLLGLGLAGVFPLQMAQVPDRVGERRTPHVVGAILAASAIGGSLLPAGIGVGMQVAGVGALPWFLLAGAAVLLLLNVATDRLAARQRATTTA